MGAIPVLFNHAVDVQSGRVTESVAADDGLIGLHREAGEVADHAAGTVDLLSINAGLNIEEISPGLDGHDDLFQRGVAGALARVEDETKARLAEIEIMMQQKIAEAGATGDVEKVREIEAEKAAEIEKARTRGEEEKERIRGQ